MKLSYAVLASVMTFVLFVSAAPSPQEPTTPPALPSKVRTPAAGGKGGKAFDDFDLFTGASNFVSLAIQAGEKIDRVALRVEVVGTIPEGRQEIFSVHGGDGGIASTGLSDDPESFFVSLSVRVKDGEVIGLALDSNKKKDAVISGKTTGGTVTTQTAPSIPGTPMGLCGFHGRSGKRIDALGAIWCPLLD